MEPTDCPLCDGPGVLLGTLGNLVWLRCQDCGWEYCVPAKCVVVTEPDDEADISCEIHDAEHGVG